MQRVWYANTWFLTDDRVAEALMEYASVLAVVNSADVVELIGADEDGTVRKIRLVAGPASQILAMETDEQHVDMDVEEVLADLKKRARDKLPDPTMLVAAGLQASHPESTELEGEDGGHS
jgi:hypothetical protein